MWGEYHNPFRQWIYHHQKPQKKSPQAKDKWVNAQNWLPGRIYRLIAQAHLVKIFGNILHKLPQWSIYCSQPITHTSSLFMMLQNSRILCINFDRCYIWETCDLHFRIKDHSFCRQAFLNGRFLFQEMCFTPTFDHYTNRWLKWKKIQYTFWFY